MAPDSVTLSRQEALDTNLLVVQLDLSFCSKVTDEGLLEVLMNCDKLEVLRMESCDNVTGVPAP